MTTRSMRAAEVAAEAALLATPPAPELPSSDEEDFDEEDFDEDDEDYGEDDEDDEEDDETEEDEVAAEMNAIAEMATNGLRSLTHISSMMMRAGGGDDSVRGLTFPAARSLSSLDPFPNVTHSAGDDEAEELVLERGMVRLRGLLPELTATNWMFEY